jgi:hypothetical protein
MNTRLLFLITHMMNIMRNEFFGPLGLLFTESPLNKETP